MLQRHHVRLLLPAALLLASPSGAQSLKDMPSPVDLVQLLLAPTEAQDARLPFPGLSPLPPLGVHSLFVNTFTLEPLLVDPMDGAVSFDIPAAGIFPFSQGQPNRPLSVPTHDGQFIANREAAIRLGKALFWDMQLGSDGVQACATCHFHAGADNRSRNQLNPGTLAGDGLLDVRSPNQEVTPGDFPFHALVDTDEVGEPLLNPGNVLRDSNDVLSSMGVRYREFVDIPTPGPGAFVPGSDPPVLLPDLGNLVSDPVGPAFEGLRRVEPRNTPTVFGSSFNFDNFWDGRGRHDFNGGSPHGASDPAAHVFEDAQGALVATRPIIRFSSLASLATGPALSAFEMSFDGRTWPKIGKKLLQAGAVPLANQVVDPTDSVLAPLSNQNATPGRAGLNTDYASLIRQAFQARLWTNVHQHLQPVVDPADGFDRESLQITGGAANPAVTDEYTQMEANFSLFFGLSVQAYLSVLAPDDSPFDRFHEANPNEFLGLVTDIDPVTPGIQVVGLTERQLYGYDLFQGSNLSLLNIESKRGNCNVCHFGPNLTEHSLVNVHGIFVPDRITGEDRMLSGFLLEDRLASPAKSSVELAGLNPSLGLSAISDGVALTDRGIYNIGVRPSAEDIGRGADDAFGFPLSLAALGLRQLGFPVGTSSDPENPLPPLPSYLDPHVNPLPVGVDFPNINLPTFQPDTIAPSNDVVVEPSGTFPDPNRVARMGAFKVPQLKNVELTAPYFHNGGVLTLRQVVDFYGRGGDFPVTNGADRDAAILPLNDNFNARFTESDKAALVDFLLSLTDERVKFERAPFDHPELVIPLDGTAPDNTAGRPALLSDARFRHIPAVGSAGRAEPLENFLGLSSQEGDPGPDHFDVVTEDQLGLQLEPALPGTVGVFNTLVIRGATPGKLVGVLAGLRPGLTTLGLGNCGGLQIDLRGPYSLIARVLADAEGNASVTVMVPSWLAGHIVGFQAIEPFGCLVSPLVQQTF